MGVINEMLKHNRLDVFRPKPGVALFKEFPHGEGLKCARKKMHSNSQPIRNPCRESFGTISLRRADAAPTSARLTSPC